LDEKYIFQVFHSGVSGAVNLTIKP